MRKIRLSFQMSAFCIIVSDILIYKYYSLYLCKEITYAEQTTIKTI